MSHHFVMTILPAARTRPPVTAGRWREGAQPSGPLMSALRNGRSGTGLKLAARRLRSRPLLATLAEKVIAPAEVKVKALQTTARIRGGTDEGSISIDALRAAVAVAMRRQNPSLCDSGHI